MIKKITPVFNITRSVNFLITFFSVIVAILICSGTNLDITIVLFAALSAGLTTSAGNIINDIYDIEIDEINRPERPLPSGKLSIKETLSLYILLTSLSLLLSWFINIYAFIVVIVTTLLLFLYSKMIKKIPLAGNILVAFLTGLVFIYGGIAVDNPTAAIIPAVFAFLINLIREIVKDVQDVEGDKNAGIKTFPIRFGFQKSKLLVTFFTFILILFTFYPFITQLYKIEFFVIVMITVNPLLVYCIKILYSGNSENNLEKISNILKLNMFFGLIAVYFGI